MERTGENEQEFVEVPAKHLLLMLAKGIDDAKRQGNDVDIPEGATFITLSDTLARQISRHLRDIAMLFN
jgi:hypothetical protein